jgi:hypothetical protein
MAAELDMLDGEIRELTAAIADQGMWIVGSQGQPRLNPAIGSRRQAIDAKRKILGAAPDALQPSLPGLAEFGL